MFVEGSFCEFDNSPGFASSIRIYVDQDGAMVHSEIEGDLAFIESCRALPALEGIETEGFSDIDILAFLPRVESGKGWSRFAEGICSFCSFLNMDVRDHVAWMVMLEKWKAKAQPITGAISGLQAWRQAGAQTVMVTGSERWFIREFLGQAATGYDAYFTRTTPRSPEKPSAALAAFIRESLESLELPEKPIELFYGDSSSDIKQGHFLGAIPVICPHALSINGVLASTQAHIRLNSPWEFTPRNQSLILAIRNFQF